MHLVLIPHCMTEEWKSGKSTLLELLEPCFIGNAIRKLKFATQRLRVLSRRMLHLVYNTIV